MGSLISKVAAPSCAIVDPRFCASYPIELTFFIDAAWLNCDHLAVTDINGNVVFKVEAHKWSLRNRQVVVDASGKPVISMQQKLSSIHDRWLVFKGNSSDPKHLLFSVKRSSAFQFKTELDVFLAANKEEEVCDFKIKGSFRNRSCTVYKGDYSMVIAQMSKEYKLVNGLVSKDAFGVAVIPNTDYSFITALTIIRHKFFKEDTRISDVISHVISHVISNEISTALISAISALLGGS
ncbi:protein LURP-one-related 10-like [Musa acuminata AAA Group]|uniref:protein LURP-one-related 10-like n=1 Tax=Musa acuminata AAA Group TaxID=214697 RepID=UPI0031DD2263